MSDRDRILALEAENRTRIEEILTLQKQLTDLAELFNTLIDRHLALNAKVQSDGMAAALSRGGGQGS